MLVLIDNYDSFTYNLYQILAQLTPDVKVIRNDQITVKEIQKMNPGAIVISPGPGEPKQAGICIELIKKMSPKVPILGVCLGMQAMAEAFGGHIVRAPNCVHGKSSLVFHRRRGIFKGLKLPFDAARYHSLIVDRDSLPKELTIEADSIDDLIMALKHIKYPLWGVQFHPESILSQEGEALLSNFLKEAKLL
ncbi:MAG: Anthranilate synthase component 2 [Chlamydiae bacterium]|nr:Anthranilate synthase component 2 [Chlamydiota bacterium]